MKTDNPSLVEIIRDTIRRRGPVMFDWFMEQALYHPVLGYYSSGRCAIGRRGDYFTNVSVGPLFGRLLGAQFVEMWESLGRPEDFAIVEQGAHHGDFARDVLGAVRERAPDLSSKLRYRIIEPFPILRERQGVALRDFSGKVTWEKSLDDLEPFCGVHFSNELLDAMPVRLLSRTDSEGRASARPGLAAASPSDNWQERCVAESGDEFRFVLEPITDAELRLHLETVPHDLSGPYETEVNLAALKWLEALAQKLNRGYVLTVDYGYSRENYYAPERISGTLRCYAHHRIVPSPLTDLGQVDITAHVDWTSLTERAEAHGFSVAGFTDQHHFTTGVVTGLMPEQFDASADPASRRALQTLLHPELLGTTFQFLALARNTADFPLSGFKFAREPRSALGL
ncbi:MAG TPA: SAM-dependent methyltransferase [Chthoniobacterales bacterium]|nr:SAM-dependent methyltransferase [Chthoniobacterales bacterium]